MNFEVFSYEILQRIGWGLLHSIWQIAILAFVYFLIVRTISLRWARVRYCIGYAILLSMLIIPIFSMCMIEPVRYANYNPVIPETKIIETPFLPEETTEDFIFEEHSSLIPEYRLNEESAYDYSFDEIISPEIVSPEVPTYDSRTPIPEAGFEVFGYLVPCLPVISGVWAFVVLLLGVRLIRDWFSLRSLRSAACPLEDGIWFEHLESLKRMFKLKRKILLGISEKIDSPMLIGILKPMILIPGSILIGLSPEEIEAILAHELAHIRRHDFLANLVQLIIETLLFYHPLVWWVSRSVRYDREYVCDDFVVHRTVTSRVQYAKTLAHLEQLRHEIYGEKEMKRLLSAPAAASKPLLTRIQRILGMKTQSDRSVDWLAGLMVLGIIITVPLILLMSERTMIADGTLPAVESIAVFEKQPLEPLSGEAELTTFTVSDFAAVSELVPAPVVPINGHEIIDGVAHQVITELRTVYEESIDDKGNKILHQRTVPETRLVPVTSATLAATHHDFPTGSVYPAPPVPQPLERELTLYAYDIDEESFTELAVVKRNIERIERLGDSWNTEDEEYLEAQFQGMHAGQKLVSLSVTEINEMGKFTQKNIDIPRKAFHEKSEVLIERNLKVFFTPKNNNCTIVEYKIQSKQQKPVSMPGFDPDVSFTVDPNKVAPLIPVLEPVSSVPAIGRSVEMVSENPQVFRLAETKNTITKTNDAPRPPAMSNPAPVARSSMNNSPNPTLSPVWGSNPNPPVPANPVPSTQPAVSAPVPAASFAEATTPAHFTVPTEKQRTAKRFNRGYSLKKIVDAFGGSESTNANNPPMYGGYQQYPHRSITVFQMISNNLSRSIEIDASQYTMTPITDKNAMIVWGSEEVHEAVREIIEDLEKACDEIELAIEKPVPGVKTFAELGMPADTTPRSVKKTIVRGSQEAIDSVRKSIAQLGLSTDAVIQFEAMEPELTFQGEEAPAFTYKNPSEETRTTRRYSLENVSELFAEEIKSDEIEEAFPILFAKIRTALNIPENVSPDGCPFRLKYVPEKRVLIVWGTEDVHEAVKKCITELEEKVQDENQHPIR